MMRLLRGFLIAGAMAILVTAIAGCHGSAGRVEKLRWQSTADTGKVLELNLEGHTVVGKLSMVLFRSRVKGTYVLKEGDVTTEGDVIQDPEGYTLVSKDGKKQRWAYGETPNVLKDESGTVWEPDGSARRDSARILKEW